MPKFRTLLKNRNFVLYSAGQAFSQFADRLVQIVLIGFLYKRWPGSTLMLAKLLFFTVIPSFIISPLAGVYTDRWDKRYIMIISDIFRAIAILMVPLFFIYSESIVPLYATIFLVFAAACFFLPARLAVIPGLVSKEDLLLANSASSMIWVGSGIAGFSLGGFLAEWAGIQNSLYINSAVYFISAVSFIMLLFSMKNGKSKNKTHEKSPGITTVLKKSFFYDLKEGLKILFLDKKIRFVGYVFFIFSSLLGALYVVLVVFIQETMHSMTRDIGIFGMCLFVGILVGSYIFGKIGERFARMKTMFVSLFLAGVAISMFAISLKLWESFFMGVLSSIFLGFVISPLYVTANTIIHESIEENVRGRIFSSIGILMNLGFIVFMFLASAVAEHIGRFWILILCGLGFSVFGLVNILAGNSKKATSF